MPKYTSEELRAYTNEVLQQMGGWGKLIALIDIQHVIFEETAKREQSMRFRFKGSRTANFCRITLNDDDLYTLEIGMIRKRAGVPQYKEKSQSHELFANMLQPTFEEETGLFLSF